MEPALGASTPSLPVGAGLEGIDPDGTGPGCIGLDVAPVAEPAPGLACTCGAAAAATERGLGCRTGAAAEGTIGPARYGAELAADCVAVPVVAAG